MIDLLLLLIYVIITGLLGGIATYWFMSLIGDPDTEDLNTRAIFSFYGVWIRQKFDKYEKNMEDQMTRMTLTMRQEQRYEARHINWAKSMGACRYCTGVYITALVSFLIFYTQGISLWWIFLTLPVFHFSLKYTMENLS
jgi:hypothetical protein